MNFCLKTKQKKTCRAKLF